MAVRPDATDLVFVGELRLLKGVDVLIDAIALLRGGRRRHRHAGRRWPRPRHVACPGRASRTRSRPSAFPAQCRRGRRSRSAASWSCPSRTESLPYVVLEAAAAGIPLIATKVGGIPEIYGALSVDLVPAGRCAALARRLPQPRRTTAAAAARRLARARRHLIFGAPWSTACLTPMANGLAALARNRTPLSFISTFR